MYQSIKKQFTHVYTPCMFVILLYVYVYLILWYSIYSNIYDYICLNKCAKRHKHKPALKTWLIQSPVKQQFFFSSRWNHIGSTWAPTTSAAPALSTFVTMWIPVCCASLAVKRVVPRQKIGLFFKSDGFRLHDCIFAYIWLVCTVDAGEYTIRGSSFVKECKVTRRGLRSPSSNDGERRPPTNPPFWGIFLEKLPGKSFILLMSIVIYTIVLCSG